MPQKIAKKIVVFYDGADCSDGFGGAWAAWKKFGNKAEYIKAFRFVPAPELKDKEIYMIDFTYPEDVVRKMIKNNKSVTALDHHEPAKKTILLTKNGSYSPDHSGCVLAWMHFFPGKKIPKLLQYIEDFDTWRFKLAHTIEISKCIYLYGFESGFKPWDILANEIEKSSKRKACVEKGGVMIAYEKKIVEDIIKNNGELVKFAGHKVMAVNSPRVFRSLIASIILKKYPPFGIVWSRKNGIISVSLRSNSKKFDVSKIAQKYGGSGHKGSSGFILDGNSKLPWKYIK